MRYTTIPFSFSLQGNTEGYKQTTNLPKPFRITRLYALAEPSPSQLLYVMLFKWPTSTLPTSGVPGGSTVFDDLIQSPLIRLGRIPVDMDLDILVQDTPRILVYANNGNASQQQCNVGLSVVLP